jgi:hypothetical protein
MAIKTLRVFQEFTSEGFVPMPPAGNIDYGYTIAGTFPGTTPTTFQTDNPDIDVTVTEMTDFYVWIRSHGSAWNINYTRNVRVYPDSPLVNNVVMGIIIANLDYTVPYVGATENVDLGEFGISGGFVHLDNTPTALNIPTTPGTLSWNDSDGTADLILKGGNVTLQLGQEELVRVVNKTGATLNEADFRAVRIRSVAEGGAQGQRLAVMLAQANNDANSATTIGLVTETILNNQEGFINTSGNVNKINTTGAKSFGGTETWVDGDVLYLSPIHAGYLTNVKPQAPDHTIIVGWVVYAHAVNGKIFVKVDNGYELDELHNVKITNPLLDDFLMYDTTLNVWKNKDMHGTKGYIPYFNDTTLYLNSPFWTDGGLIGVNTITPRSLLDLKGTTAYTKLIVDNNGATGGGMFSAYQNGSEVAMFGADAHYQANTSIDATMAAKKVGGGIQFYTNGSNSEKMGINADGNVFIGQTPTWTTSATNLIVRGKTGAGHIGVMHYDMSIKGFMNTFNSVFQVGTSTFHSLAFLVEDIERGRVNSSGRLLWGTTIDNTIDLVQINGSLIATSIKKSGGTSSQYLMADGSVSTLGSYVPTTRTLTINGTAYDLSADRAWTIPTNSGTVTSVGASVPIGFAISGSPITTSGTLAISFALGYSLPTDAKQTQWDSAYTNRITSASSPLIISANVISIAQATNVTNGYLTSTDWATFNAKQSALSGTGFVKVSGTTISYDNTAYTPTSRLLTINGTAYDLSADRSWTITPGSGMRNVQTFTATSGQTTFIITGGYTAGLIDVYVNGARLSTSDYTATSGTSVILGVGVVTNDIVDIVAYTASATSGITGTGTSGYLAKWSGTTAINGSLIYDNGTNIGIGTTSPSAKLEVKQSTDNYGYGYSLKNIAGNTWQWVNGGDNNLYVGYNTTTRFFISSAGNVGIANTSPQDKLQIGDGAADAGMIFYANNALSGWAGRIVGVNASGNLKFQHRSNSATFVDVFEINGGSGTAYAQFYGKTIFNQVGIGTSSPGYKLHVAGQGYFGEKLTVNIGSAPGDTFIVDKISGGNIAFYENGVYGGQIATQGSGDIYLGSKNVYPVMVLKAAGNVGIGTTAPSRKLEVASDGTNWISGTFSGTGGTDKVVIGNLAMPTIGGHNSALNAWSDFTIAGVNIMFSPYGSEKMRITSGGQLMINTTSDAYGDGSKLLSYSAGKAASFLNLDGGGGYCAVVMRRTASNGGLTEHYVGGTYAGGISVSGSSSSYNTSSDYRLKEDLKPINGLEKLSKINVYDFKWKNSDDRMDGVIAHELQEILPYAVFGKKDGEIMQGVDYSKIVPVLVQAVKDLNAKIKILEAK